MGSINNRFPGKAEQEKRVVLQATLGSKTVKDNIKGKFTSIKQFTPMVRLPSFHTKNICFERNPMFLRTFHSTSHRRPILLVFWLGIYTWQWITKYVVNMDNKNIHRAILLETVIHFLCFILHRKTSWTSCGDNFRRNKLADLNNNCQAYLLLEKV